MWCTYMLATAALVAVADAYSAGAPTGACKDMIPRHPLSPQTKPAPYIITPSTTTVKAGSPMELTISGKSPSDKIRGLLLQARSGEDIVGSFKVEPNDPVVQLLNCGKPDNAVTHKKHDESQDKQHLKLTWTPPSDLKGEIKFRATIALNGAVFWVGVESAPVKVV
ncbi:putative defense protein Hdd11 [Plodia interpunctella]|uniref:putative defense protein Hdd11 n=1 Tax=Plodia interpunctella TaxID=58824 RepID=UPI002368D81E|nr:putative defense protein Hdd11 [Plodia interpunctella]